MADAFKNSFHVARFLRSCVIAQHIINVVCIWAANEDIGAFAQRQDVVFILQQGDGLQSCGTRYTDIAITTYFGLGFLGVDIRILEKAHLEFQP